MIEPLPSTFPPLPLAEDLAWMQRVAAKDAEAFEQLVDEHRRLVGVIACRMIGDPADREDICQEVFLRVLENARQFRGEAKLSTWIGRIAYHTCLNHLRKKKEARWTDMGEESNPRDWLSDQAPGPEAIAEKESLRACLRREMERLSPTLRIILSLFHLEGMSYEEIGRVLELPAGTVKSTLFRARQKLRERLMGAPAREVP